MLVLKFFGSCKREEKLRSIVILPAVGHRQQAAPDKSEPTVDFILERFAPNTLPSLAGVGGVAALHYEVWHHSEELSFVIVPGNTKINIRTSSTNITRLTPQDRAV